MRNWFTILLLPYCVVASSQSVTEEQEKVNARLMEIHEQMQMIKESPIVQKRLQETWEIIQGQEKYENVTEKQFYRMMEPYYAKKILATQKYHHKGTENMEREAHKSIEMFAPIMTRNIGLTYQKFLNKKRKDNRKETPNQTIEKKQFEKIVSREQEEQKYIWTFGLEDLDKYENANNRKALILALGANGIFDKDLAFEAFSVYAENGNSAAMNNLGIMYLKGWGTNPNPAKAIEWFECAGATGCADGYVNAGLYEKQQGNMNEARNYFIKSTETYHPTGYYLLGYMAYYGEGDEPNYEEAFKYFKDAASFGDISAIYMLSECYKYGKGVDANEELSKLYFEKSKYYSFKIKTLKKH